MAYKGKHDETEARERLQAFWEGKSIGGSPAVAVTSDNPEWEVTKSPLLSLPRKERELLPDWQAHQTRQSIRGQCFVGEAMPGALVAWGAMLTTLPMFAGGDYDFESEDSSAWVRVEENYLDRSFPVFDPESPLANTLDACHLAAREAIEGYGFVSPPLMTDPLTTLSQLVGAETTAFALVEEPDRILQWTSALTDMYIAIFNHYYALCDAGECIVFGGPMARGPAEAIQCDFSVMLSPKMYAKHVVPYLS